MEILDSNKIKTLSKSELVLMRGFIDGGLYDGKPTQSLTDETEKTIRVNNLSILDKLIN